MASTPLVTILMSVYNGEKYLADSIDSILNQSYKNFEFLIINDCSTDNSKQIINKIDDERIRLVENSQNIGLTKSLNKGLDLANGTYIARMDADDISLPSRIEEQVKFMETNLEVGVAGSWISIINDRGEEIKEWRYPSGHNELVAYLLFDSCIVHPSAIIRKSILDKNNIRYDEALKSAQDYPFWYDCSQHAKLANIPKVLLQYRKHEGQISVFSSSQRSNATQTKIDILEDLGVDNDRFIEYHKKYSHSGSVHSVWDLIQYIYWVLYLLFVINKQDEYYVSSTVRVILDRAKMQ